MNKTYKKWAVQVHQLMKLLAMQDPNRYREDIHALRNLQLFRQEVSTPFCTKLELKIINAVRAQGVGYELRRTVRDVIRKVALTSDSTWETSKLIYMLEDTFLPQLMFHPPAWNKYVNIVHKLNERNKTIYFETQRYMGHEEPHKSHKAETRIRNKMYESLTKPRRLNPPVRVRHERPNDDKFYIRNLYFHLDEKEQELVTAFQIDRQYQKYYRAESQNFDRKYTEEHGSLYSSVAGYHKYWRDKGNYMYVTILDPLSSYWRWKITQDDAKRKLNKLSNRDCIAY